MWVGVWSYVSEVVYEWMGVRAGVGVFVWIRLYRSQLAKHNEQNRIH